MSRASDKRREAEGYADIAPLLFGGDNVSDIEATGQYGASEAPAVPSRSGWGGQWWPPAVRPVSIAGIRSTITYNRPRLRVVADVLGLLLMVVVLLTQFRFFSLFREDCRAYRVAHVPWCNVADFFLAVAISLVLIVGYLAKRTSTFQVLARLARRVQNDTTDQQRLSLLLFAAAMVVMYVHYVLSLRDSGMSRASSFVAEILCHTPKETLNALVHMGDVIQQVFAMYGVAVFMDYGTLFGAMRYGGPLPWDHDIDLGLLGDQMVANGVTAGQVLASAREKGIGGYYDYWYGFFRFEDAQGHCADVMEWRDYFNIGFMRRTGWETILSPLAYTVYHTFPAKHVADPASMPTRKFGTVEIREPRDPVTFLSYRYDTFYRESRPYGCDTETYKHWDGHEPHLPFKEPENIAIALAAAQKKEKRQATIELHKQRLDTYMD